jgi:glycosyltransferase involved in cell wall biosynthesis
VNQPLVTVSIPTYNSEAFLERCLEAVYAQSYKNIEVNIVDGFSSDQTMALAQKHPLTFLQDKLGLLNARKLGMEAAKGEYVLLLDSDQILAPTAIERAVQKMQQTGLDMLVLEENVFRSHTFLEKLFQLDRELIHAVRDFSPFTGVMLPRFYKKSLLAEAFSHVPAAVLKAGGQDHAIIYYEAWQLSQKVDLLPAAVRHIEPSHLREIIPKFYRWGYTSLGARDVRYKDMLRIKEHFRKGMFRKGLWVASLGSITLLLIKGAPYQLGRLIASVRNFRKVA